MWRSARPRYPPRFCAAKSYISEGLVVETDHDQAQVVTGRHIFKQRTTLSTGPAPVYRRLAVERFRWKLPRYLNISGAFITAAVNTIPAATALFAFHDFNRYLFFGQRRLCLL